MFDRIAPTYDRLNRLLSVGIDARWRARAIDALAGSPSGAVLDLCAGTMDLSALLHRARPDDRIVALDFSASMLEAGRHKAPRAEVIVADASDLPFGDQTFAAVLCAFGMRNLADLARGLHEVRRILRPGGVFVTLEFFRPDRAVTRAFHAAYARLVLPTVGGLVSGDRGAYAYLARSIARFFTREQYERAVRDAGFESLSSLDLTWGVASIVRGEAPR
jgi:ubiquinone/menaquinone biosynthesis methyltransferase